MGHLLLLLTLLAPAAPACEAPARCTCIERLSMESARTAADAVFLGTVTSVREVTERSGDGAHAVVSREVAFSVDAAWKGLAAREVLVYTGTGAGDCGFPFEVGKRYLVYGYGDDDRLGTGVCTRTGGAAEAGKEIEALGAPHWSYERRLVTPRSPAARPVRPRAPASW
jgi:hypothetical protein